MPGLWEHPASARSRPARPRTPTSRRGDVQRPSKDPGARLEGRERARRRPRRLTWLDHASLAASLPGPLPALPIRTPGSSGGLSVGTGAAEDSRDRLEQDPEVAAEREVLHVVELYRQALGERERPAPKDLHRAGDPGLDRKPEAVLRAVATDQIDLLRPWADNAHVALQHVHELRQLIEAEPSEYAPDARDAWIPLELEHRLGQLVKTDELLEHLVGAIAHRSEFVDPERNPAEAGSRLDEQERPPAVQFDRERDDREQRSEHDEQQQRRRHVEDALDEHGRPGYVPRVVLEHGQVRDLGEPRDR